MVMVDVAGMGSPSQGPLVAPAKSLWSDTPASPRGLGGPGRGQRPAGCESETSLLGKPGWFLSSNHPCRGGDRVCGAIRGVILLAVGLGT